MPGGESRRGVNISICYSFRSSVRLNPQMETFSGAGWGRGPQKGGVSGSAKGTSPGSAPSTCRLANSLLLRPRRGSFGKPRDFKDEVCCACAHGELEEEAAKVLLASPGKLWKQFRGLLLVSGLQPALIHPCPLS